jgi:hypothetical protein
LSKKLSKTHLVLLTSVSAFCGCEDQIKTSAIMSPVGAAGLAALGAVIEALAQPAAASAMAETYHPRLDCLGNYREKYRARAKSIPQNEPATHGNPASSGCCGRA